MEDDQSDSRGEARHSYFVKQQLIDSVRSVFQLISALLKNASLYPESHPILLTSADKLKRKIEDLMMGRNDFSLYLADGELFFEKISIPLDENASLLMEHFAARDIGAILCKPGIADDELIRFARVMNRDTAFFKMNQDINGVLLIENIFHLELHHVLLLDKKAGLGPQAGKQKASEVFKEAIDTVKDMVQVLQQDRTTGMRKMNSIVQSMVDNILVNRNTFMGLTHIKMHDEYTFAHCVNVSILAVSLGVHLSFAKPQLAALGVAGLMHDIGKVRVPAEIINKPGKLTDEEWQAVKRHPVDGALLLAGMSGISKMAMVAAFEHHQLGGPLGYPHTEGEHVQHPFSRIVSLVDAYDAITAARVYYQSQTPPDEAIRILLKKRGSHFNPVLVNAFVRMIGIFPIGTVVQLNTGEIGLVKQQTNNLLRPRLLILTRFDGSETEDGAMASLLETRNGRYLRSITGTIDPFAEKLDLKKYFE